MTTPHPPRPPTTLPAVFKQEGAQTASQPPLTSPSRFRRPITASESVLDGVLVLKAPPRMSNIQHFLLPSYLLCYISGWMYPLHHSALGEQKRWMEAEKTHIWEGVCVIGQAKESKRRDEREQTVESRRGKEQSRRTSAGAGQLFRRVGAVRSQQLL